MDGLSHRDVLHAQADPLKEVNTVKKLIANRYSFFQIKRHITLKNEQLQVVFWKKRFSLQKFDASNPLNTSYSKKLKYPKEN